MLELYNTMSRKKEAFEPLDDKKVKMFTCGPSVYRRPHVGNYRSFLWEDLLQRYLEYLGYQVERVINLTDVEDKAILEAEQEGSTVQDVTGGIAEQFFREARLLKIRLPDVIPRSSTSVDQAVVLIKVLLHKGYAYWHGRDVFFDPLKFEGFGRLYGLDMQRWPKQKRRFRKDTYPGTRWNLGDFILWHGYKEGDEIFWETEIGKGRPAWNVQDPAIITKHLGHRIDIACGGVDNLFRHHDYNIAVIEAAYGEEFARYWVHGEHLLVNGKKMSKSKGNIIFPETLLEEGSSPQHLRFYLLYGHHRKKLNLTRKGMQGVVQRFDAFKADLRILNKKTTAPGGRSDPAAEALIRGLTTGFEEHMNNDLDVRSAFDTVSGRLSRLVRLKQEGGLNPTDCERARTALGTMDQVFQFMLS